MGKQARKLTKFLADHARAMKAIMDGGPIPPSSGYVLGWAKSKSRKRPKRNWYSGFYRTKEWAEARYAALKRHGGKCQACGRSAADGATINVDHIKSVSTAWHLRLDPDNHQVLCGQCNRGKGWSDATDWRP